MFKLGPLYTSLRYVKKRLSKNEKILIVVSDHFLNKLLVFELMGLFEITDAHGVYVKFTLSRGIFTLYSFFLKPIKITSNAHSDKRLKYVVKVWSILRGLRERFFS